MQTHIELAGESSRVIKMGGASSAAVRVEPGDALIRRGRVPAPTVMKIDVEGFELDVLIGLAKSLTEPSLRFVGVEVHFALLAARGLRRAPREIEVHLRERGFWTRWTDASHIIAERRS